MFYSDFKRHRLQTMARDVSGHNKINLHFGDSPGTNFKQIIIRDFTDALEIVPGVPCTEPEAWIAMKATVCHEAAHLRFTDISSWSKACLDSRLAMIVNSLEDLRIERAISERFAGAARWIDWTNRYLFNKYRNIIASQNPPFRFLTTLMFAVVFGEILPIPEQHLVKKYLSVAAQARMAATTEEVLTYAADILRDPEVQNLFPVPPELPNMPGTKKAEKAPPKTQHQDSSAESNSESSQESSADFNAEPDTSPESSAESEAGSDTESNPGSPGSKDSVSRKEEEKSSRQTEGETSSESSPAEENSDKNSEEFSGSPEETPEKEPEKNPGGSGSLPWDQDFSEAPTDREEAPESSKENSEEHETEPSEESDSKEDNIGDSVPETDPPVSGGGNTEPEPQPEIDPLAEAKKELQIFRSRAEDESFSELPESTCDLIVRKPNPVLDSRPDSRISPQANIAGKNLAQELKKILEKNRSVRYSPVKKGHLNPSALYKTATSESEIFRKKSHPEDTSIAVYVLVDCSGSMEEYAEAPKPGVARKRKIDIAVPAVAILSKALGELNIPHAITGFTTGYVSGKGDVPLHLYAKTFASSKFYSRLLVPDNTNKDGHSIRQATKELLDRNEKTKLLIILSDGLPTAYAEEAYYAQDDHPICWKDQDGNLRLGYGVRDTSQAVREAQKQGIGVVGIHIGENDPEHMAVYRVMYPHFIHLENALNLPRILGKVVKQALEGQG